MGAALPRVLVVLIDIIYGNENVCGNLVSMRCAVRSALTTEHDGAVATSELSMTGNTASFETKAFGKSECAAEPLGDSDWRLGPMRPSVGRQSLAPRARRPRLLFPVTR